MEIGGEYTLATAKVPDISSLQWHNLRLRFIGDQITGYIDGKEVLSATSDHYKKGMAGLIAPLQKKRVCTPYFDNLSITPLGSSKATQPLDTKDHRPLYQLRQ